MHSFLWTLLVSLALEPSIRCLHAQETVTDGDVSLTSSTKWSMAWYSGKGVVTDKDPVDEDTTLGDTTNQSISMTMNLTESVTDEVIISSESHTAEDTTTFHPNPFTTQGSITTSTNIATTSMMVDTEPATDLASTESTVLSTERKTTKLLKWLLTSPTLAPTTTESISTPSVILTTNMPARSTRPRSMTTTSIITTIQEQTSTLTPETEVYTSDSTMISTINETVSFGIQPLEVEREKSEKGLNWIIIGIVALVVMFLTIVCFVFAIKRKKKSCKQHFGQMNGRSKKKKGGDDDVWAGPVTLGAVEKDDSNNPEEALVQSEDKPDGPEVMLSTFTMPDDKAAVGRPGSQEVKRWEEQERLLYIDEDAKGEEKKEEGAKESETGETAIKEAMQNGGEAFCLTTAV